MLASNLAKDFQSLANNIIFMPSLPPSPKRRFAGPVPVPKSLVVGGRFVHFCLFRRMQMGPEEKEKGAEGDQCVRPLDTLPPHFLFRERRRQRRGCSHVRGRICVVERVCILVLSPQVHYTVNLFYSCQGNILVTLTISQV